MDQSAAPASPAPPSPAPPGPAPLIRRLAGGFMRLDVRNIANIKVEDMALAGGYFVLFWLLDAVNLTAFGNLKVEQLASAWPAIAVLGCTGVLFRRTAPVALAWMCGIAAVGLLLAGHAGAFVLIFEFFFSLVLFGSTKAAAVASRASWVLTLLLVIAAFAASQDASIAVVAGVLAVVTLLTPVEWAGNLRKANQLAESESARADAVQDAAQQRILAERNAHDLALEHERQHMARELHDVISARLSAIALQSGAALHAAKAVPAESAGTTLLRQIRAESVSGLDELNTMIRLLHSGASSEAPGRIAELPALLESHRAAGMAVRYSNSLHDGGHHLPLQIQTTAYRIASESLANAARHAPGKPVAVSLAAVRSGPPTGATSEASGSAGRDLLLTVSSALPEGAAGASTGTGTGIPSMHFRAAHAGGTLSAAPDGEDWKVALRLPLPDLAAPARTENQPSPATHNEGPAA